MNHRDHFGHLLVLPCPAINTSEKPQQSNPGRIIDDLDTFGVNMWFPSPDIEPRTLEVLADGEGNIEKVILKDGYKY